MRFLGILLIDFRALSPIFGIEGDSGTSEDLGQPAGREQNKRRAERGLDLLFSSRILESAASILAL